MWWYLVYRNRVAGTRSYRNRIDGTQINGNCVAGTQATMDDGSWYSGYDGFIVGGTQLR